MISPDMMFVLVFFLDISGGVTATHIPGYRTKYECEVAAAEIKRSMEFPHQWEGFACTEVLKQ